MNTKQEPIQQDTKEPSSAIQYAGFWVRLTALTLDFVLALFISSLSLFYITSQRTVPLAVLAFFICAIFILNPFFFYIVVFLTHAYGGSFGKLLTGLRVVDEKNKYLSLKRAFFRTTAGYSFSWIFFGLGFFSVIKDEKKQAWHDKAVGSYVIRRGNWIIVSIMLIVLIFIFSCTLMNKAISQYTHGPLLREARILINKIKAENKTGANRYTPQYQPKTYRQFTPTKRLYP